jgi:hypothetical protein
MRNVMTSLAVLALMACGQQADTTVENVAEENMAMDANAVDANAAVMPAAFQLNDTTWEFTRKSKNITETVDASGNFVAWSGAEHVDHGTAVMKDGKACFTSAMDQEGEVCWTTAETAIGSSMETTSDKGEKLTVKRVAFMAVPDNVKP